MNLCQILEEFFCGVRLPEPEPTCFVVPGIRLGYDGKIVEVEIHAPIPAWAEIWACVACR